MYELKGVGKEYAGPGEKLEILRNVDLDLPAGESVAVLGASGSGKTTLLHLMGGLDKPTTGTVLMHGKDLAAMGEDELAGLRNRDIGFVFQFHHLLPEFSTVENVAMQALVGGEDKSKALDMAREALRWVDMDRRAEHKVTQLSGGERQRAAIARAILMSPKALLADEPTGNLDAATGQLCGELLVRLNCELGMTLVVVTHNQELARMMNKRLELRSGDLYAHPY